MCRGEREPLLMTLSLKRREDCCLMLLLSTWGWFVGERVRMRLTSCFDRGLVLEGKIGVVGEGERLAEREKGRGCD